MIRALVFDFDGLILDTETPILAAWAALHEEAGLPHAREDAVKIVGHVDVEFDPWSAFPLEADREFLEREHKKRSRDILSKQAILPGVEDYLVAARGLSLRLAIASNSHHEWIDKHLERLGLSHFFEVVKCRDDVKTGKPNPEVYLAVLHAFGITGAEAIAFEDSEPGSMAAKAAGLWCVAVPNPSTVDHELSQADLRLTSMKDLSLQNLVRELERKAS